MPAGAPRGEHSPAFLGMDVSTNPEKSPGKPGSQTLPAGGHIREPSVSKCAGCEQYFPQGHIHYYADSDQLVCVNCTAPADTDHVDPVDAQTCIDNGSHDYDSSKAEITYNNSGKDSGNGIHIDDMSEPKYDGMTKTYTCLICGLRIRERFLYEDVEIVE